MVREGSGKEKSKTSVVKAAWGKVGERTHEA